MATWSNTRPRLERRPPHASSGRRVLTDVFSRAATSLRAVLLLFDIDGTLVRGRPLTHQLALERAASEVFGLRVEDGASPVADVEPWGKTDRQILRDVLVRAGLPAPAEEAVVRWER